MVIGGHGVLVVIPEQSQCAVLGVVEANECETCTMTTVINLKLRNVSSDRRNLVNSGPEYSRDNLPLLTIGFSSLAAKTWIVDLLTGLTIHVVCERVREPNPLALSGVSIT